MNTSEIWASGFLTDILLFLFKTTLLLVTLTFAVFIVGRLFWWRVELLPRGPREQIGQLFGHIYYDLFAGAWRLAVLASAAIALTVASAFTTWGGLRSFTEHDADGKSTSAGLWLALAIAFGIQVVMLIAAWIIGESFAGGMSARSADGDADTRRLALERRIGMALGVLLAITAFWWIASGLGTAPSRAGEALWQRSLVVSRIFASGLLVVGIAYCFRTNEFIGPYVRGFGVVVKNAVVWVMFLASFAMSVFFSLDYHFNAIFSERLRKDSADMHAQKNISKVTNYLGNRVPEHLKELQDALFAGPAWKNYQPQLDQAAEIGDRSPDRMRELNLAARAQQADQMAELDKNLAQLNAEINPLVLRKATLNLDDQKAKLEKARQQFDLQTTKIEQAKENLAAAKAAAKREETGVEGPGLTGKAGRKAGWAKANKKVQERVGELEAAELEMKPIEEQLNKLDAGVKSIVAQLATIEPQLRDLTSRAEGLRQSRQDRQGTGSTTERATDTAVLSRTLDSQISEFRRTPDPGKLKEIQTSCTNLKSIGMKVADGKAAQLNCDPGPLNEALTGFLDEKTRIAKFKEQCTLGSTLVGRDVGDMINFARTCLQDSRLPRDELQESYDIVDDMADVRDDKAQSFIRTLNAIRDQNPLLGLALGVAITVDSLIFFAGVFAATTMIGPLQRAGLRDVSARVRRLPARDVRWALTASRDHAFTADQCNDPRINRIVLQGLDRQIPGEAPGSCLVLRDDSHEPILYRLHEIYRDELEELVQRAERRGDLASEAPAASNAPEVRRTGDESGEVITLRAPRPSARAI